MPVSVRQPPCSALAQRFLGATQPQLQVLEVSRADPRAALARDIALGFTPPQGRSIPPTYFYDAAGSALYEQITTLEEYYPTRTEADILRRHARALAEQITATEIVELGSGSATKTRLLLDELIATRPRLTYMPIDVSSSALAESARHLAVHYPGMRVLALNGDYQEALDVLPTSRDRLVLFLGGTIGNFPPAFQDDFFKRLASQMASGQQLLLGFDRRSHAGKSADTIQLAYNDPQGVTARFNLNVLVRLNRELGADFDLAAWRHEACYNQHDHQIEMYLVSDRTQIVTISAIGQSFEFGRGERLLTELSRKFDPEEVVAWFACRGFQLIQRWTDDREYFELALFQRDDG